MKTLEMNSGFKLIAFRQENQEDWENSSGKSNIVTTPLSHRGIICKKPLWGWGLIRERGLFEGGELIKSTCIQVIFKIHFESPWLQNMQ